MIEKSEHTVKDLSGSKILARERQEDINDLLLASVEETLHGIEGILMAVRLSLAGPVNR